MANYTEILSTKKYLLAIFLGLLVIPAGYLILLVFVLLKLVTGIAIGDLLIALPFGLGAKGILISFVVLSIAYLIKTSIPCLVAWIITRSKKLTGITLISAIGIQIILYLIVNPAQQLNESAKRQFYKDEAAENKIKQSVQVGSIKFALAEPVAKNVYPQYGQAYTKLILDVPLVIKVSGTYRLRIEYRPKYNSGFKGIKEKELILKPGEKLISVDFASHEIKLPCYWLGTSESRVKIEIFKKIAAEESLLSTLQKQAKDSYRSVCAKEITLEGVSCVQALVK